MDPGLAGAVESDPDRVVEPFRGGLVVAGEAREDRQPRAVGRGPRVGPQRGRAQVPRDTGVGVPARLRAGLGEGAVELEERATGAVDDEHVAVAVAVLSA